MSNRLMRSPRDASRVAAVFGIAGALLLAFATSADRAGAFQSYLFVWWFLLGISLGSLAILMVHNLTGVVIGMSYIMIPFIVLPLQATMHAIDPMVLQAGSICGASPWTNFWKVFLPLCRSGLFSGALMVFVMSLGYYVTPALLGGAQNMMLPEFIIQQVQSFLNWGLASAGAALLIVITLVLFYFYLKLQPESPVGASNAR